ncbi:MAG: 16S rRNA (cytosine(1402)-N(4))-methyltransferase, partial [Thermoanaerobaculia bacterium]|nr:16S rRNA (cytosine(1402)-N(4))-methyltransferase [Thermoanaerobaculia bacterium]
MPPARHVPVLRREVLELLAPERGGLFVDCTVGDGGHAAALLERGPEIRPPEDWAHPDAAEAFHARGWFVLAE